MEFRDKIQRSYYALIYIECPQGSYGINCTAICPDGYYGHLCRGKCPLQCNETCNKTSGSCQGKGK